MTDSQTNLQVDNSARPSEEMSKSQESEVLLSPTASDLNLIKMGIIQEMGGASLYRSSEDDLDPGYKNKHRKKKAGLGLSSYKTSGEDLDEKKEGEITSESSDSDDELLKKYGGIKGEVESFGSNEKKDGSGNDDAAAKQEEEEQTATENNVEANALGTSQSDGRVKSEGKFVETAESKNNQVTSGDKIAIEGLEEGEEQGGEEEDDGRKADGEEDDNEEVEIGEDGVKRTRSKKMKDNEDGEEEGEGGGGGGGGGKGQDQEESDEEDGQGGKKKGSRRKKQGGEDGEFQEGEDEYGEDRWFEGEQEMNEEERQRMEAELQGKKASFSYGVGGYYVGGDSEKEPKPLSKAEKKKQKEEKKEREREQAEKLNRRRTLEYFSRKSKSKLLAAAKAHLKKQNQAFIGHGTIAGSGKKKPHSLHNKKLPVGATNESVKEYLVKHKIKELFDMFLSSLVNDQPVKPVDYLLDMAREMNRQRKIEYAADKSTGPCPCDVLRHGGDPDQMVEKEESTAVKFTPSSEPLPKDSGYSNRQPAQITGSKRHSIRLTSAKSDI